MYINDLPDGLNSTVRFFADDALLYGTICCDEDTADLQDDLYRLEDWQQKWQMEFDPCKCKIMCFTTRRDPPKQEYVFSGEILEGVESGLEKNPVRSSGTSRFSLRASNFLSFLAQGAMSQASCSLTKFLITILRRKGKL